MVIREQRVTLAEFFSLAALPENEDRRLEWEDGVIVDVGSSSQLNTVTAMRIGTFLNVYVIQHNLGYVTGADAGFYLANARRARRPDTAFVAKSHNVGFNGVEFNFAPDLAVEVVSPDEDIFKKAKEYLHSGTKIVWAVYAEERMVYVMTLGENGAIMSLPFGEDDALAGGDVLPGFSLPVREIFPNP